MSIFVIVVPGAEEGAIDRAIGPFTTEEEASHWLKQHYSDCSEHLSRRGWVDWGNCSILRVTPTSRVLGQIALAKEGQECL